MYNCGTFFCFKNSADSQFTHQGQKWSQSSFQNHLHFTKEQVIQIDTH